MPEFTTKMKEYRAKKNIKQGELAEMVGVRRETIIRLEKGQYNPSLKLALDVAKALDTTVEELFIFNKWKYAIKMHIKSLYIRILKWILMIYK